jgi:hypothetical protein
MSTIKLPAASGGGSISLKGPSSAGSDTDFLDTSGNLKVTGNTTVDGKVYVNRTTALDSNHVNFSATKALSAGIPQNQINIGDAAAYNTTDNGGAIGFSAIYSSGGASTTMASIEGVKTNNTDGNYNGDMVFKTRSHNGNNVTRMRLTDAGLCFGSDTASSNALSDYEEGDWTPASREGTITYSNAKYTKIGQLVWVNAVVTSFSERTTTTDIGVTGLPFQVAETCTGSCVFSRVAYTGDTQIASIANTSNRVQFLTSSQSSSGTWFYLDYEDLQASSSTIEFSIVYRTTA